MTDTRYFLLYANCIPVDGVKRSGICDLQKGRFETIPNSMYEIINSCKFMNVSEIKVHYGIENHSTIDSFFEWLVNNDFGFMCEDLEELSSFPELNQEFDVPHPITNILIDIDSVSAYDFKALFRQIAAMAIPYIQIRSFTTRDVNYFVQLLDLLEGSRVKGVEIITPYYDGAYNVDYNILFKEHLRLNTIVFHASPVQKFVDILAGASSVQFSEKCVSSEKCCGFVSQSQFVINQDHFFEAKLHNTCLNKKISVDKYGFIRNCPSMVKSFGHIDATPLSSVLQDSEFSSAWQINKDSIATCKNCEFRYICTDCRAYLESPEDMTSKPLKCGYNPETATWEDWSTNPLKRKALSHYGFTI